MSFACTKSRIGDEASGVPSESMLALAIDTFADPHGS
jgi:hypothetical protein